MIPLMVHNLHPKMIESFIAVKPKTFAEFYTIAKTAENNLKRFSNTRSFANNDKQKPAKSDQNVTQTKRKPPNACRICENLGFKGRYHWANDCRNKGKTVTPNSANNLNTKTINTIETKSNANSMPENDMNRIDLN